jgi:hypothetical protein
MAGIRRHAGSQIGFLTADNRRARDNSTARLGEPRPRPKAGPLCARRFQFRSVTAILPTGKLAPKHAPLPLVSTGLIFD